MSEKNSPKIDKYYATLLVVLVLMAVLVTFSFRGVFSAFLNAGSIDPTEIGAQARVDQEQLEEVYSWVFDRR